MKIHRQNKFTIHFFSGFILFFLFCCIQQNSVGQAYFQQKVDYQIKVILNDKDHSLNGNIEITYYNHSPDSLKFIYFHLWPNAYKNNNTAFAQQQLKQSYTDFFYAPEEERGYIDSLSFSINGIDAIFITDSTHIDIGKLVLNQPLPPGTSISISTPFFVKIPDYFSRLGHEENDYYITQWYPKPAVYDKNGWHAMPYLDQGEFFSEYGKFNVDIFVPKAYIVAATGNQQISNMLEGDVDPFLQKHRRTHYKKVSFTEENIHDFAWFTSKNFVLQERFMQLPGTNRKIKLQAFHLHYIAEGEKKVLDYMEEAILYYSKKCIDYPYNTCKAVIANANGGMEYPTITVVVSFLNTIDFESVIVHELGHNWFYGILGSNERNEPWIDEGMNTFYELSFFREKYGNKKYKDLFHDIGSSIVGLDELTYTDYYKIHVQKLANENNQLPLNLSSEQYDSENYYSGIYFKTALGLHMLKEQLGEKHFDEIMQSFFQEWQYQHPSGNDIYQHFKTKTDSSIDWFFKDYLSSTEKNDYKIEKVKGNKAWIGNTKKLHTPVQIKYQTDTETFDTTFLPPTKPFTFQANANKITRIKIDPYNAFFDINQKNNNYSRSKLLHKSDPVELKLLGVYEKPGSHQVNFVPFFGWNNYDKLMPGIIFYNSLVPAHTLEYFLFPSYGISSNQLTGTSLFQLHTKPRSQFFHSMDINLSFSSYTINGNNKRYSHLKLYPDLYFIKDQNIASYISLNYHFLNIPEELLIGNMKKKHLLQLSYNYEKDITIVSNKLSTTIDAGKGFVKAYAESQNRWKYANKSAIDARFFAGVFLYETNTYYGNYNFRLAGWLGRQDYRYTNIFFGRSESPRQDTVDIFARQFVRADGGFTTYTTLGQTNNWIIASNFSYKPPFVLPLKAYLNIALVDTEIEITSYSPFFWETGIEVFIIPDIFELYFPVFMSSNLKDQSDFMTDNYWDKIRFTFAMDIHDPYLFIKSLF